MSSTTVHSKKENDQKVNNPAPVCGQTIPTNKTLEVPPKTAKWGISEKEVIKSEELGEIVFSQVENSKVNADGTLEMQDGTTIVMVNPKVYQALLSVKKTREEMRQKAEAKTNIKDDKAKTGMGRE